MTSDKMPLILDNPMPVGLNDVDDLFGDGVGLSIPVRSQSKRLHQRMDELRSRGCCQSVAWSKTGTIASITPDGLAVELRYLQRNPENGSWDLSEPTPCDLVSGSPTIPIVHLAWAGTSVPDLAVIDSVGRVSILSCSISLNHAHIQRKWDSDSVDEMHGIMGAYWLSIAPSNQQSYNVMHGPANKHGTGYTYESSFVHAVGPNHPNPSKSALFTVTSNGTLRMFWSQANNRIEETTMELESVNLSDARVTHAAFASEKKFLILALATTSTELSVVKIDVSWGVPNQSDKNNPPQAKFLNPSLVERHLSATSWLQLEGNDGSNDANMSELSHLEVLPSLMDHTGKNTAPPMVVAIRSRAPSDGSYQMAQSILDRWEAIEHRQNLHNGFEQLGNRRNSITSEGPNGMQLRKLDPIIFNKIVIGLHIVNFGKALVLAFADGSVEHRDRFTFEELYTTEDRAKVMNLRQAGWTFADEGPCQQMAFSPTYCSMVQMGDDGKVRWNKLHYPPGDIGNSNQDAQYSASVAALTVTTAPAIFYQNNYDDILAIARPYTTKKRFTQDWITELIRILKIQVDYSEDTHHDALVRNGSLQSCLSIMNALGFRGDFNPRSFQGKFSMLSLNVRNVVVLITIASNTPLTVREKLSPLDEPEVVETLAGCAKWSLDLLAWLIDCLFELMNDNKFMELLIPQRFNEIAPYLHDKNNIALHFLLSSSTRGFLSAVCRRLGHLEALSTRAIEFYRRQSATADQSSSSKAAPQLQQAYQRMQHVTSSGLVKVAEFEKLLTQLGADIRQTYQAVLPSLVKAQQPALQGKQIDMAVKTTRVQFELALLLSASPHPPFLQIMHKFFNKDLRAFRALTDPAQLFFANYDLLEVQDDKRSLAAKKAKGMTYVDVFKRLEIKPGPNQQWRRCARCARVMEDVFVSRPGFSFVLAQQRKCACNGLWTLVPGSKLLS
ncbi:mediator complex, subunit Med16 [Dactylonectria macrodidyma]|uniref:Mediator of RNA polymerase II transcription subunit 16 n=1 Tax=Dactylonectria macrodidyma TaxID=307937 RepID=A0A9P9FRI9_9HYPO|nr:mediator complex, subunit Med16 [Dactylonectria macrodidyma]